MPTDPCATAAPYEHPPYRCGSIQCGRCYDLIGPTPVAQRRETGEWPDE